NGNAKRHPDPPQENLVADGRPDIGPDRVEDTLPRLEIVFEQRQRMGRCNHAASPRVSAAAWRMAEMLLPYADGPPWKTAEPATSTLAPAATTFGAVSAVMPPSTSRSIGRPAIMALTRAIFSTADGMKAWPPKPGLTDITSTRSTISSTYSMALSGVAGLIE